MDKKLGRGFKAKIAVLLVVTLICTGIQYLPAYAKKTAAAKGVVIAEELYMRTGPGTEYKNISKGEEKVLLVKDQEVSVLGLRNGWYHIKATYKSETFEGYSLSDWIKVTEGTVSNESGDFKEITPTPTPTPKPKSTGKGKVTASELYVRKGPGTDYDIVLVNKEKAILVKDQEVNLYGETDGWYHITAKIGGKTVEGYSSADYIEITKGKVEKENAEPTKAPATEPTPEPTKEPKKDPTPVPTQAPTATPTPTPVEEPDIENVPVVTAAPFLPQGAVIAEDGAVYDANGNGMELETATYTSKYDVFGYVTAELLNMRKKASLTSDVLGILSKDTVVYIVGTKAGTITVGTEEVKTRWYRIITMVEDKLVRGYVLSDYVELNLTDSLLVKNTSKKQGLKAKASGSGKFVTDSKGKKVSLSKGTEMLVINEKQVNGKKWLKVRVEYNKESITGWILARKVAFVQNTNNIDIKYYVTKEENAATQITDLPTVTPPPADEVNIENANAVIKDAAALSLKEEPKYSAGTVFTEDKLPVTVYSGQGVRVTETASDSENIWCKIEVLYNGKIYTGYVNSVYINSAQEVETPDETGEKEKKEVDFEEELTNQGFPNSYKPFLRELHEQYPNWVFKAYDTGLEWSEVIENESKIGENLIPNTRNVGWKSLEAGAYSWESDKFTVFDGSSWVTASKAAISYYMDPRNFLGHDTIFQFEVLNYNPSFQTREGIDVILKNTAMNGTSYEYTDELGKKRTISYTDTFFMAAEYSGVSPIHLASRVKQEVTLGSSSMSNSVSGTVSGLENLYNYYNIGAYHSTAPGGAIANGLKFAKNGSSSETLNMRCLIPWNNRLRSIIGGAYYIGNNYINRGQNTIYLQKFNVTGTSTFNHQYMANVEAPYSEGKRMYAAYENPAELPIVFSIPVYKNMPKKACPAPADEKNPNNWLKTLKLYDINGDQLVLSPAFSVSYDGEYSLTVDYETEYIKVTSSTVSSLAKISSEPNIHPKVGKNRYVITVQAENGDVREYVINIKRKKQEITNVPTPTPEPTDIPEPTGGTEPTEAPVLTEEPADLPKLTDLPEPTGEVIPSDSPILTGIPDPMVVG